MQEEVQRSKRSWQAITFFVSGVAFGCGCLLLSQEWIAPQKAEAREPHQVVAKLYSASSVLPESLTNLDRFGHVKPAEPDATETGANASEPQPCYVPPPPRQISGSVTSRAISFSPSGAVKIGPVRPDVNIGPARPPENVVGATPPPKTQTPPSTPTKTAVNPTSESLAPKVAEIARRDGATVLGTTSTKMTLLIKKEAAGKLMEDLTDLQVPAQQTQSREQVAPEVTRIQTKIDEEKAKRAKLSDAAEIKKQDDAIAVLQFELKKALDKSPTEVFLVVEVGLLSAK